MVKSPLARTGLATLLTLTSIGTLAPSANAAPSDAGQQVICDDIGLVQVQRFAGSWRILDEAPLSVAATGLPCRAATTDAAGHLKVTGEPLLHVVADTEAVIAAADRAVAQRQTTGGNRIQAAAISDPAGYGKVTSFPFASQLSAWTSGRSGSVALAARATGSSTIYSHVKGSATNVTASIVKVAVMATVMDKAQREGRALTSWEKSQMVPMIRYSDNAATTNLWNHVGRGPAVGAVLGKMGLRQTTPGPGGYWGLTVTSAPDQVVLMDHFARSNPVINATHRSYGLSLMRTVASDQDWGVTAGPGDDIAVKNGWLPRSDGWHVNSIGHSHKTPGPYSIAALTHSASSGMSTQISTIEGASRIIWGRRSSMVPRPEVRSPRRGDFTSDGRTDLVAVKQDTLYLVRGLGEGRMAAPTSLGRGWSRTTWIGAVGDVTRDGRQDLVARREDGSLHLWRGLGDGTFSYSRGLGTGWAGLTSITAVGDFDANGTPDLLARRRDGSLVRYALPASGNPVRVASLGTGWGGMSRIMGALGVNTDLKGDVLALRSDKRLFAYTSTGTALSKGSHVAGNWTPSLMSGCGDTTGDGIEDICYQSGTRLVTYPISRGGKPMTARASGTSLAGFRLLG